MNVILDDLLGILVALHWYKDVLKDIDLIYLVIKVKECIAFVYAIFYKHSTALIYRAATVYNDHALVIKAVGAYKFNYTGVVVCWCFLANTGAIAAAQLIWETVRPCRRIHAVYFLAQAVSLYNFI